MSITLQDRVYFGAFWQMLDRDPAGPDLVQRGGFGGARVERTSEGDFFAGVVEKRDAQGRVTDVVLAFAGAHGADAVQGESILIGLPQEEAARATALYDSLLANPAYAGARIHVTGHSLGAGYTQYVLAHAVATHGEAATDARADFVAFGAPNWLGSAARHFGLSIAQVEGRFTDYTADNDPVLINGVERQGVTYYLPAFVDEDSPADFAWSAFSAHWPTTYGSYLGLPAWLSAAEQTAAFMAVDAESNAASTGGTAWNPNYRPDAELGLFVEGSGQDDALTGLAGDDVLRGDRGADRLTGGGGADTFRFDRITDSGATSATADRIVDFDASEGDRIDLSRIDANALTLWDDAFTLIDGRVFTAPGQLSVWRSGGTTWVAGNVDLDDAADFLIRLDGRHTLSDADFLL